MKLLRLLPLSVALGAAFAAPARAQSLLELYESARAYDATWQSAKAQYDANLFRAEQARAGVLPSANLGAGVTRSNFENTFRRSRTAASPPQSATVSASQPLYRPANFATWEQGKRQVELAQAQLTAASQDLIIRVSQAYFDVLAAQDTLAFVQAQKTAVAEQLASAKRNFEVGTSTITDTREAQARYDLVIAQEIAAENDLRVKKLALDALVGKPDVKPNRAGGTGRRSRAGTGRRQHLGAAGRGEQPVHPAGPHGAGDRAARNREGQGRPQADARPHGQLQRHAQPERQHPAVAAGTRSNTGSVGLVVQPAPVRRLRDAEPDPRNPVAGRKGAGRPRGHPPHRRAGRAHRLLRPGVGPGPGQGPGGGGGLEPERARTPTAWATRSACASTSTC